MMNHVVLYPVTNPRSRLLGCTQSKDHWLGFRLGISQLKNIDTLKDKDIAILTQVAEYI
jgi:hypothetical protein